MTKVSPFQKLALLFRALPGAPIAADEEVEFDQGDTYSLDKFKSAVVLVEIPALGVDLANVADEADLYLQVSYDLGVSWEDVANIHFENADDNNAAALFFPIAIGPPVAGVAVFTHSDKALADDTNRDLPLGTNLRIALVLTAGVAPTLLYEASVSFYG